MANTVMLGSLLASFLAFEAAAFGQPAQDPDSTPLPRAQWLENGIIDAGGSHEPYTFMVRTGSARPGAYEAYQWAQSEEVIRRLKEQGVEVFHTHLYKGFGTAAEKAEMEDARRAAEIAHRYGLKVDSYIQWNTMMYETFFAEEPKAKNWIQRDVLGKPILLVYGYQQSFRYRPCFGNQEYLDYLKKIVRYAVQEVKSDFIHFDNFDLNPEPDSCHCDSCTLGFRKYLRTKYTPEKRRERFGFENVDFVNPPQWNVQNPPERMRIIADPGLQEWVDYRCQQMSDALRQMAAYAKSMNPEVAIEVNPHGIAGANRAWEAGLDHARFLKWTEAYFTEEENPTSYLPDGRLLSRVRSYKLARAFNNVVFTYTFTDPVAIAECLTFNQTIGFAGTDPLTSSMRQYIAFYRKYRDLYVGAKDAGNIAVLRSYPSITYNNAAAQLSAILVEQALLQSRVPFDLIFDEHLKDLSRYRVVILPNSECLSDQQVAAIRAFVEKGGGLVATEQSGIYDEWRRFRGKPGLEGLVDAQQRFRGFGGQGGGRQGGGRRGAGVAAPSAAPARKEYGQGRVVYFPAVEFDGPLPEMERNFKIGGEFWRLPKNWKEITEAVRWAARDEIPVQVSGPDFLVAHLVSQLEKRRMLLHLVNINARNVRSIGAVQVSCRLPSQAAAKEVRIYSPDSEAPVSVAVSNGPGGATFTVPDVKTYSIAAVSW